ncbi:hypothetical protein DFH09DRAFT_1261613 [Mycena vulgaris]|nr:hypothetical protein DFH09DRAFT_1261613 [Mycena vulgaris]
MPHGFDLLKFTNTTEAFNQILPEIKLNIIKSRHDWNSHEPKMWARAEGISDEDLVVFTIENDLILVSSTPTTDGTIILGKICLPAIDDDVGKGYIHIRIHDPTNTGTSDVVFHSLFTDEGHGNSDGNYRATQTEDKALELFN